MLPHLFSLLKRFRKIERHKSADRQTDLYAIIDVMKTPLYMLPIQRENIIA
jgi:hypothetical protein